MSISFLNNRRMMEVRQIVQEGRFARQKDVYHEIIENREKYPIFAGLKDGSILQLVSRYSGIHKHAKQKSKESRRYILRQERLNAVLAVQEQGVIKLKDIAKYFFDYRHTAFADRSQAAIYEWLRINISNVLAGDVTETACPTLEEQRRLIMSEEKGVADIGVVEEQLRGLLDRFCDNVSQLQVRVSELQQREEDHACPDTRELNAIIAEKEVQLRRLREQYEDLHRQYTVANQENLRLAAELEETILQKSDPDEGLKYELHESKDRVRELEGEVQRLTARNEVLASDLERKQRPIGLHNLAFGSEVKIKSQ